MSVNKIILIGNLGGDPDVTHLDSGATVAKFSLATSESYKNNSGEKVTDTQWHSVVLWNKLAVLAEKFLNKGSKIYLEGKITYRKYETKEGDTRYMTEIIGNSLTFLGGKVESVSAEVVEVKDDLPF